MIIFILIVLLIFSLYKWFSYKCMTIGLMYFASIEHNWDIDDKELKKILEYSIKRNIKDFFRIKN